MEEKTRRFRTHVLREILETERVYCGQVAFITEVSLPSTSGVRRCSRTDLHLCGVVCVSSSRCVRTARSVLWVRTRSCVH